jgi:hypothetical protein
MNARADDPNCAIRTVPFIRSMPVQGMREDGRQKRLRRLDYMGKSNGPFSPLHGLNFARDRFARRDALQKFCANRFFHREAYAKKVLMFKVGR